MKQLVNENKLYSVIGKFFTDGNNLLFELIQNSQRAKADNIRIMLPYTGEHPFSGDIRSENMLCIEDDGMGIKDVIALLGIATSDWTKDIDPQDPAGMGFLQLIALSKQVSIRSSFGSLLLDCQRFLNDADYRQEVLLNVNIADALTTGTVIIAEMAKAWVYYMRQDHNWYRGHTNINLEINGTPVVPITIKELIAKAEVKKNLYTVVNYLGNSLFIEIGNTEAIVSSYNSAVNWYGQIIPVHCSTSVAGNYHIRLYYEVNKGTPLTPRYPDRTSLSYDDRYTEFMAFVNRFTLGKLREYFDSFPEGAKFSAYTNHSLLITYYQYAPEVERNTMKYVPVIDDAFASGSYGSESLITKQQMIDEGIAFHEGSISIDDHFNLGADTGDLRCYSVRTEVAPYLRKGGIREIVEIEALKSPEHLINLEPLILTVSYADGNTETVSLNNALLMNDYDEAFIYADTESLVHSVFEDYFENIVCETSDYSRDELQRDIITAIDERMAESYSIINPHFFDFLPKYHDIKTIHFEYGNLAVAYNDGSQRDFAIQR